MKKVLLTLIKREYWENYPLLYRLPLWLSVVISVILIVAAGLSFSHSIYIHSHFGSQMNIPIHNPILHLMQSANILVPIFTIFLWITMFTYALRTLFTDRKDGSIFFFHSMPTPQWLIITAKLFTLFIIAPFCSWVMLSITQWVMFLTTFIMAHHVHFSFSHFLLTAIINMIHNFCRLFFVGFWLSPILGLCFIASAYVKRSPAVPVFVCLFLICALDFLFDKSHIFSQFILSCFTHSTNGIATLFNNSNVSFWNATNIQFILGIILASICFIIAGNIRSKNLDFRNN